MPTVLPPKTLIFNYTNSRVYSPSSRYHDGLKGTTLDLWNLETTS
jgi:hypothetical protein